MKTIGLRGRILLLTLIPVLAATLLLGIYFIQGSEGETRQQLAAHGGAVVKALLPAVRDSIDAGSTRDVAGLIEGLLYDPRILQIRITDASGDLFHQETAPGRSASADRAVRLQITTPIPASLPGAPNDAQPGSAPLGHIHLTVAGEALHASDISRLENGILLALLIAVIAALAAIRYGNDLTMSMGAMAETLTRLGQDHRQESMPVSSTVEPRTLERVIEATMHSLREQRNELEARLRTTGMDLEQAGRELEVRNRELVAARNQAVKASRDKTEFLANMSHEIRTPLNGMLGFIDLILRTPLSTEQREYVTTVRKSATNLMVIVNDILDFSKIESGKLKRENIPFNLRDALEDSVDLMAPLAHDKGLELVLLVYADVPMNLFGDANRIRQVLLNLIGNAIKFTRQGNVVVRTMLDDDNDDNDTSVNIKIQVSDTGIGLTPEQKSTLFSAFVQADTSPTRRFGGTGLGLFISRRLVELLGGSIGVESLYGSGSTFWFRLPLGLAEPPAAELQRPLPDIGHAIVCDAHPLTRLALRHPLEEWGIRVIEADDIRGVRDGLVASPPPPDFIVVGLSPGRDGRQDTDSIIQALGGHGLPLVLLINSIDRERLNEVVESGAAFCLTKPCRRESLRMAVWKIMQLPESVEIRTADRRKTPRLPQQDYQGLRVLVADDNEINRRLTELQLDSLGVYVDQAVDGRQALALAGRIRYDMILLDEHMPNFTGTQTAHAIRIDRRNPNRSTPIVALTADALFSAESTDLADDIQETLIKPVSEYHLWKTLERWTRLGSKTATGATTRQQLADIEAVKRELEGRLRTEIPDWLETLNRLHDDGDIDRLGDEAHRIKGSSLYCGIESLAGVAAELEAVCRGGLSGLVEEKLSDCVNELQRLSSGNGPPDP